jgi:isoquinoline 1-oxidoreductase subunit beta
MAHVAEVEVSRDGTVRVRRVVCAIDCGTVVNPDTVQAQIQSGIIFGTTAALYREITLKNGSRRSHSFKNGVTVSVERQQALRPCVRGSD